MTRRVGTYLRTNTLGLIAIFIALSAGAYAAGLGKNSVKSKQIKAGAVKNAELSDDAVTAPKVENGSLRAEDFAAGQIPAGPQGPEGPAGSNAPADGPALMSGSVQSSNPTCLVGAPTGFSVSGSCDNAGIKARGGIVPTAKVVRNVRFEVPTSPVGPVPVFLARDTSDTSFTSVASCTIEIGQTACSVTGPVAVPAGSRLFVQATANITRFWFGYELWNPSAAPRAAAPSEAPTPRSVSSD